MKENEIEEMYENLDVVDDGCEINKVNLYGNNSE